ACRPRARPTWAASGRAPRGRSAPPQTARAPLRRPAPGQRGTHRVRADRRGASEPRPRRRRAGWWRSLASQRLPADGSPYYSHGMAALPPRSSRRRPRRGSLERPVSGRLYRGTWLLVGIPLLVAAFSVHKPNPLPTPQPALPASFDTFDAVSLASDLARLY